MSHARSLSLFAVLGLSSAALAAVDLKRSRRQPASPPVEESKHAPENRDATGVIMPVFDREAYADFFAEGFRVRHRLPSAKEPYLTIEMESPTHDGYGGSCVARNGPPVDLTRYRTMEVEIDAAEPEHEFQIKLERKKSGEPGAQFYGHEGPLPRAGRQTLSIPLVKAGAVLPATQRICFALTADGFRNSSYTTTLKVYRVSFREIAAAGGTTAGKTHANRAAMKPRAVRSVPSRTAIFSDQIYERPIGEEAGK